MRVLRCCVGLRRTYLVWPIILILIVGAALTALLPPAEEQGALDVLGVLRRATSKENPPQDHHGDSTDRENKFTLIIQTYNRTDILLKLLNHYQAVPHLQRIIIVWNNVQEETPRKLWNSLGPHPVPVVFKEQASNRMRNRLQPFAEIDTDAVLLLDDDTLVSVPDTSFAFSVWKQFPDQIVGFVPRKHVSTPSGVYSYGSFELQDPETAGGDKYSMVLIGAAFFHHRYLQLFQEQPVAVHALVDETQNCDDIAMNFVVSLYLRKHLKSIGRINRPSGVFVKPVDLRNLEKEASSGYQGMWHRPEHLLQRSYCLNRLTQIYGFMPLCFSNLMVSQFGFPSYANHKSRG
ncbi:exostosin-like 2 [Solea senegalensis]|uniref:Exostosin-like 2 n=1 Tax=Solea senegalensis TaxID=28829 RepID=A0AAV6TAG9_SOLSE|nr:exostosin-like 2 isoform X2 [Solea senegalensis]KAG7526466.1 exostosin-like 2 [Solea senegalensis]